MESVAARSTRAAIMVLDGDADCDRLEVDEGQAVAWRGVG